MGCISPVPKIPNPDTKRATKLKYTPGKPIKQHYVRSFINQKRDLRTLDLNQISFNVNDYEAKHIFRKGSTFYSIVQHKKSAKNTYILKEIDVFRRSEHELETLKNELRVQALCNHKNIVKLYGFKEENHKFNVLQEFLEENLEKFCAERNKRNEPLLDQEIMRIYSAILSALNYLHKEFNFSPQDLNPSHVLVSKDLSKIKINIAGSLHIYEKPSADSPVFFSGDDRFMAPELRKKFKDYKLLKLDDISIPKFPFDEVDLKDCDGYSLGLLIIYMCSTRNLSKQVVNDYIDQMSVDQDSHSAILNDLKDFIPQKISSQVLSLLTYEKDERAKVVDLFSQRKS